MTSNPRTKNGNARRKIRARLRAEERPCHICNLPIDYELPAGHPYSFEVDEIIPVSRGGSPIDYNNVDAAHRICNEKRGNKMHFSLRRRVVKRCAINNSREW